MSDWVFDSLCGLEARFERLWRRRYLMPSFLISDVQNVFPPSVFDYASSAQHAGWGPSKEMIFLAFFFIFYFSFLGTRNQQSWVIDGG